MLRSMTGFGGAAGRIGEVQYQVEVKSVNNRYCKVAMKLPDMCSAVELDVEKAVRRHVGRGMVTVWARVKLPTEKVYSINSSLLATYVEQLRLLEVETNPLLRIDLGGLLQLPGVCEYAPPEDLVEQVQAGLLSMVEQALEKLTQMRQREGEAIQADLLSNCSTIERKLQEIAERAPGVVEDYRDRLSSRVQELMKASQAQLETDALAREVALFAERCDIAEEISRLRGHVEHFRHVTATAQGPVGRKLDFLAQEMLREANTIASKANDAQISKTIVEIKTAVDRIKEQVQNVE